MNTFSISIGNKEYVLTGENELTIKEAAELVDSKIKELKQHYGDEPLNTLTVLAALNIAEQSIQHQNRSNMSNRYLLDELGKMAEYLKLNL